MDNNSNNDRALFTIGLFKCEAMMMINEAPVAPPPTLSLTLLAAEHGSLVLT